MKKILATIFALSVISTAAFARNFFSQRFFEIKTGAELGVSNNLFAVNEFMKKDLVIDLRKIADDCPENGFNLRADVEPMLALNLNIKDFHLGVSSGLDVYETCLLEKIYSISLDMVMSLVIPWILLSIMIPMFLPIQILM